MTAGPGRKAARSVDQTMRSILDASRSEFALHGFAGTRIDAIARRARVNKQALYYHFGSKEKLYGRVLEDGYRTVFEFIQAGMDGQDADHVPPERAVEVFVQCFFDAVAKFPEIMDIITDENKYRGKHLKGSQVTTITNPYRRHLTRAIERGAREGVFRDDQQLDELLSLVGSFNAEGSTGENAK